MRLQLRGLAVIAATGVALTVISTPAMAAGHGRPTMEREVIHETFFDEFALEVCGIATNTTRSERIIVKTFPDGTERVHVVTAYVPEDPRVASERYARTETYALDGSITIKGLGVRLYRKGEGTIIRAAGWVRFDEDGMTGKGPHDFHDFDPADLYC
jgi:hypothetical protein